MWKTDKGRYVQLFFHGAAVLQDKQAELAPVSTVPWSTGWRPRLQHLLCVCSSLSLPQACSCFAQGHDCSHASSSVSFGRCLLLLHRPTGPVNHCLLLPYSIYAVITLLQQATTCDIVKGQQRRQKAPGIFRLRTAKHISPDGFWRIQLLDLLHCALLKLCQQQINV